MFSKAAEKENIIALSDARVELGVMCTHGNLEEMDGIHAIHDFEIAANE